MGVQLDSSCRRLGRAAAAALQLEQAGQGAGEAGVVVKGHLAARGREREGVVRSRPKSRRGFPPPKRRDSQPPVSRRSAHLAW